MAADTSLYIPIIVYGVAGLLGLIASLMLPIETKGRQMTVFSLFFGILFNYCLDKIKLKSCFVLKGVEGNITGSLI